MATKRTYIERVGRRREATARVRFYEMGRSASIIIGEQKVKKGDILVNNIRIQEYFPGPVNKKFYEAPLKVTNTMGTYAITVKVVGGGKQGQRDAVIHGMARVLDSIDAEKYHDLLKKHSLLTRDARAKERRKAGLAQKARAKKSSPKR